jgi:hypothetical protein
VLKDWQAAVGRLVLQARERWREGVLPNVLECGGGGMTLLALALLSILPRESVVRERCDLVEINHFYDEHARLVFDQIIFMDWQDGDRTLTGLTSGQEHSSLLVKGDRYQVRAWRLIKSPNQLPLRDWEHGGYVTLWQDGEVLRQVRTPHVRESWTQAGAVGDPELNEREYLPKERRRELRPSRVLKR